MKPNWEDAPEWANWLALNVFWIWTWFENKPTLTPLGWGDDPEGRQEPVSTPPKGTEETVGLEPINPDVWRAFIEYYRHKGRLLWRESLEKRPSPLDKFMSSSESMRDGPPDGTPPQKWIDVIDYLPEEKGVYLCYFTDGATETFGFPSTWHPWGASGCCVTHWRPLPEPPEA